MGLLCAICNEIINFTAEIHVTPCGHLFHFGCLAQWLPRSSTCPECRRKTTLGTIQKLYPNIRNDTSLHEELCPEAFSELQSEKEMLKDKIQTLEAASLEDREKLKKLQENLIKEKENVLKKEAAFDVVKRQCDHYRAQASHTAELEKRVQGYEEQNRLNTKISDLLTLSANEVDSMMSCKDVSNHDLKIFVTALKRELRSSESKRHNIKAAYQQSQHDCIQARTKCDQYKKKLESFSDAEQKLATAEAKVNIQKSRIQELEAMLEKNKSPKCKLEVPNSNSPYMQIESSSVGMMPLRQLNGADVAKRHRLENSKYTIFKKPRLSFAHSSGSLFGPSTSREENLDARPSAGVVNLKKSNSMKSTLNI